MSAHNSAANDCLGCTPSPPTSTFSQIQGKWYYRAEVVLTEPETAPSTRPTSHLSAPSNLPRNLETQEESKVVQMRVSVNTQRELKMGSERWGGERITGEGKKKRGIRKNRECADIRAGVQK